LVCETITALLDGSNKRKELLRDVGLLNSLMSIVQNLVTALEKKLAIAGSGSSAVPISSSPSNLRSSYMALAEATSSGGEISKTSTRGPLNKRTEELMSEAGPATVGLSPTEQASLQYIPSYGKIMQCLCALIDGNLENGRLCRRV
jgi:hypothetical protein